LQISSTIERFMMLHLDINPGHVSSLESALASHVEPVTLTGACFGSPHSMTNFVTH
jgi:hypothetical protein